LLKVFALPKNKIVSLRRWNFFNAWFEWKSSVVLCNIKLGFG